MQQEHVFDAEQQRVHECDLGERPSSTPAFDSPADRTPRQLLVDDRLDRLHEALQHHPHGIADGGAQRGRECPAERRAVVLHGRVHTLADQRGHRVGKRRVTSQRQSHRIGERLALPIDKLATIMHALDRGLEAFAIGPDQQAAELVQFVVSEPWTVHRLGQATCWRGWPWPGRGERPCCQTSRRGRRGRACRS